jgi:biopolymer transport protein TolQ
MKFMRFAALAVLVSVALAAPASAQRPPSAAPTERMEAPSAAPTIGVDAVQTGGADGSGAGGISITSLLSQSNPLVMGVLILLLAASLWSWAIIINKWISLGTLKRKAAKFEKLFWSGQSLDELYQQFSTQNDHPMTAVFVAGMREWRRSFENGAPPASRLSSIKDRIEKAMSVTISRETDGIERQLGFLATVGSTAPFVGLFGTVIGIMNSFTAIAARHDTTLATVAPGIADALFATALGLLAAIPAVIFYNRYVNEIARYGNRLDAFADEFSAILSRQLDEKAR